MGGDEEYEDDDEVFEASLVIDDSEHTRKAKSHEAEAERYLGIALSNPRFVDARVAVQAAQVHATLALAHYTANSVMR